MSLVSSPGVFATLFLKLNQVAQVAFAKHHSIRNFVERVHVRKIRHFTNMGLSRAIVVGGER